MERKGDFVLMRDEKGEVVKEADLVISELCFYAEISRTALWHMRNWEKDPLTLRYCPIKGKLVITFEEFKEWRMRNPDFRCP